MPHGIMPVLRRRRCDFSAALDDHGSLCCMVLNCLQLIWKLRDTEYLGRRCKALAAIAGGVAINAATIKQVSKEPFVATVPLVCCIAAAAGDLSRRLLLQRVADLPEIVDFVTPTGLLLWALALWPGRTRVVAAAVSLAFYGVAASRTVVATAGALGVNAFPMCGGLPSGHRGSSTAPLFF